MKNKICYILFAMLTSFSLIACGNKTDTNRPRERQQDTMSDEELIQEAVACIYSEPEKSLSFLEPAADKGNNDALFLMGYIYGEVYRWQGKPDYQKALECFEKSEDLIYSRLCIAEYYYVNNHFGTKDYSGSALYEQCEADVDIDAIENLSYKSVAYYVVGRMYRFSNGATYDDKLACDLYEKSAELGNPEAMENYAYFLNCGRYRDNIDEGISYLEKSIELNNYYAMYELGKLYIEGKKVTQDIDKGVELMTKAAEHNCDLAVKYLGYAYYEGEIVEYDEDKAEEYFAQWIDIYNRAGRLDAYFYLSKDYYNGFRIKQNYGKAREYYEILLDAGMDDNAYMLGVIYFEGQGVEVDIDKAIEYFVIAADSTEGEKASRKLADLYYEGELVERDINEAIKWYEKAATEWGAWGAARKLGDIYSTGDGVDVDKQKAQEWYKIAKELEPDC